MNPLMLKYVFDPRYPDFPIPRLLASINFEPVDASSPSLLTLFEGALVDSGAPYLVIPREFHSQREMRVYQELGLRPYRMISESGDPGLQRFVELGMRFLVKLPNGSFGFWPTQFVRAKAYLLDQNARPRKKLLFGLDALIENFVTHLEKDNCSLQAGQPSL